MDQPRWLEHAWRELDQKEQRGNADNARIVKFYRDAGHSEIAHDEIAWCAAFVGASLERAGMRSTRSLLARSYLGWGAGLVEGRLGAISILSRGPDPAAGHVGFLIGEAGDDLLLLGGNQDDGVSVAPFARSRLLGFRWPAEESAGKSSPAESQAVEDEFARALAHVLEMEGGFSDDRYDPGGPTNFGITLAELASWRGVGVDPGAYEALKGDLRRIAPETVTAIYRQRYWLPAHSPELPAALAFMQFDTSVNQGVGGAMRMLQEAVGASVDGEWGPETAAAVEQMPVAEILTKYAQIRRRHYRSLPTFWRFGRGWLRRVDRTLAHAREILGETASRDNQPPEGDLPMTSNPETPAPSKWWGESMTVWGAIITALATVLPAFGPALGIDLTGELVQAAGSQIVAIIQAIAGLAGTLMTIFGRVRATQPLERRAISLKL
jgi:uncharacterized protein (TIGR02594 family)